MAEFKGDFRPPTIYGNPCVDRCHVVFLLLGNPYHKVDSECVPAFHTNIIFV
ncbi:MAG TPA: hypothetical protein VKZ42_04340 [Flavobacteriaceae bacterium]|nr:hypothetical protein [Flavobacteriaceae bacterium]